MAKLPPLAILPPLFFVALAGLFLGGMFRSSPDALPSTLIGSPAPVIDLDPMAGLTPFARELLDAPGAKIVNYWASWCAPCRVEHPQLMTMADEGLPVYGVNYKDDVGKAKSFLTELGNPYEGVGADPRGRMAIEWGVYGVPETFVIDGKGRVVLRFAGPITADIMEKRIRPALAEASAE
ncbi:MAG: DsbE family thiol:disulfide interchange protein [Boseongicola sp.]|nr:MAG: DsbE family thiol:disulfide interchange protein [Boseongicola sp.]